MEPTIDGKPIYEAEAPECIRALNGVINVFSALALAKLKTEEIQKIHAGMVGLMVNPRLTSVVMAKIPCTTAEGKTFEVEINGFHVATVFRRILESTGKTLEDLNGFSDIKV